MIGLTREELSRALRVAAREKDTDLGDDAAFALRRQDVAPTLPRLLRRVTRKTGVRVMPKPRRVS